MEFIQQHMEFIQQNYMLMLSAAVSGGLLLFFSLRRPDNKHSVNATQATMLINREDACVIDVREPSEYVEGHLPESRNIPLGQLEQRLGDLERNKATPVILICQSGARSAEACKKLEGLGFTRVHNLEGGVAAWRAAGMPLRKGAKK